MTRPKRPLPSLRFVVLQGYEELYRFIPQTTPKGRVLPDLWVLPGAEIRHTSELIDLCKRRGLCNSVFEALLSAGFREHLSRDISLESGIYFQ